MSDVRQDNEGYRRFREAMQAGKLQAGMVVTQNELCDLLGLSLSPLRQTLVLLEEFGLVEIKPRDWNPYRLSGGGLHPRELPEQTLFLVDPETPGMEIRRTPSFLHDPYIDHHPEVVFTDCRVPDANRVPASGDAEAKEWILVERLFIAARCCGAALRLVDMTAEWAQEREAFGSPIAEYQGISFPLADSLTELHAARLLTYHAAHAFDVLEDRKLVHGKVSMAKLFASEMAGRVADRAVQALGGRGYMTENAAARFYRELRVDRIWEGTSEIQRSIISRGVFKRGAAAYLD